MFDQRPPILGSPTFEGQLIEFRSLPVHFLTLLHQYREHEALFVLNEQLEIKLQVLRKLKEDMQRSVSASIICVYS